MADETIPNHQQGAHPHGQDAYGHGGPFMDDAPTEVAPSAYAAPAGYESPTQTAGPGYAQQNAQWAGYSSAGQYQSAPQGYATGPQQQYQTTPYGSMPPHSGAQVAVGPPKRNRATGWIIGLILALAAIAGFGLVLFFLPSKSSNTATTSPTPTTTGSSAVTNSSTSSSPTSSDITAAIPAGATTHCQSYGGQSALTENEYLLNTRISCPFADQITSDARNHRASNPSDLSFSLPLETSNYNQHPYDVSCSTQQHLTTCSTTSSHGGQIGVYFQDGN